MTILSKIRWIASILLVFFIVLVTNIIDRDNFNKLSYSVTTIYEDRIVASDLIFDISRLIQEKQIAAITNDTAFYQKRNSSLNQEINSLIEFYKQTKLTENEEFVFNELQDELKSLEQKEPINEIIQTNEVLKSLDNINQHLYDLSKVQLQEGRRLALISNRTMDTINLFTQGEIIFLIVMAIIIQIIILYKPRELNEK